MLNAWNGRVRVRKVSWIATVTAPDIHCAGCPGTAAAPDILVAAGQRGRSANLTTGQALKQNRNRGTTGWFGDKDDLVPAPAWAGTPSNLTLNPSKDGTATSSGVRHPRREVSDLRLPSLRLKPLPHNSPGVAPKGWKAAVRSPRCLLRTPPAIHDPPKDTIPITRVRAPAGFVAIYSFNGKNPICSACELRTTALSGSRGCTTG